MACLHRHGTSHNVTMLTLLLIASSYALCLDSSSACCRGWPLGLRCVGKAKLRLGPLLCDCLAYMPGWVLSRGYCCSSKKEPTTTSVLQQL